MHPTAQAFEERAAAEFGFEPAVYELSEGTKTAQDAADAVGCDLAQIVKSMVMVVDDELVVCLTSGVNGVSTPKLASYFEVPEDAVRTANPGEVKETLGWSIGGVPPFCHDDDVPVLLDGTLAEQEEVWAGAGTPNAVFPIAPERLREFANASRADVFEGR